MKYEVTPSDLNEQTLASAVSGNAQAMVVLGKFFAEGAKPARDLQAARRWFEQAGQLGSRAGMFDTGLAYERGDGGPPDRSGAQHWYRTAAELGDVSAALNLIALRLAEPPSLAGDTQTLSLIGKAVEGGSSAAMLDMGYIAENGRGIAPNESEAFRWYGRAAEKGDAEGAYRVALAYASGVGVPRDDAEALRRMKAVRTQGDALAENVIELMSMYQSSCPGSATSSVVQTLAQARYCLKVGRADLAAQLFKQLADVGSSYAILKLADLTSAGDGVPKDEAQALLLYKSGFGKVFPNQPRTVKFYEGNE